MFENKEIKCVLRNTILTGKVIGLDPDVGLTIVNADNNKEFILCMTFVHSLHDNSRHGQLFQYVFERIEEGRLSFEHLETHIRHYSDDLRFDIGNDPSSETCPFNQ